MGSPENNIHEEVAKGVIINFANIDILAWARFAQRYAVSHPVLPTSAGNLPMPQLPSLATLKPFVSGEYITFRLRTAQGVANAANAATGLGGAPG